MGTSQQVVSATVAAQVPARDAVSARWAKLFVPSFADCFFAALIVWLFLAGPNGWNQLLADADAGWHIRTGEYILDHHAVPRQDLFSFTKPDAPWFAWEWLSDVTYAALFRAGALKGVVLFAGILIALFATILLRHIFWRGVNAFVALPLALLVVGSSTMHFLARPHLFTMLLLAASMWLLEADRKRNTRALWLLIPVTAVWTNLHGGFAIFLACLALAVCGSAIEAAISKTGFAAVRRYGALLACCAAASLINPYGIGLHRHIIEYLRSDWIRTAIQEFQAPTFRTEGQMQFELLLVAGLLTSAMLLRRRRITEALWILALAHASLNSVRHAPIFAIVAGPLIAEQAEELWRAWTRRTRRNSIPQTIFQIGADLSPSFRRSSVWIAAAAGALVLVNDPIHWPSDFPKEFFPVDLVRTHAGVLEGGRVLTTDQWGDYLIFRFYPTQRVYVDGRSDFYGESLGKEYLRVLQLAHDWREIMERRAFTTVLLPMDWPLVEALKRDAQWKIAADTGKAILFISTKQQPVRGAGAASRPQTASGSRTKENPVKG